MRFARFLALGVAALSLACESPTAPAFATAVAEVFEVSAASPGLMVKTKVTVANATPSTLYVNFCASSLERHVSEATWQPVAGIFCLAIGYPNPFGGMLPIAPGSYREVTLHLYTPEPLPDVDATDRFRVRTQVVADFPAGWWGMAPVVRLSSNAVFSNEFQLDVP
jgi:hypothetical protein